MPTSSNGPKTKAQKRLFIPPLRSAPHGVVERLPVSAAQALFRGAHSLPPMGAATPETDGLLFDDRYNSASRAHHVMSPVPLHPSRLDATLHRGGPRDNNTSSQIQQGSTITGSNSSKAFQKLSSDIDAFVEHEIGILATQNDGTAADMGPQRLAVFKAAFRMVLPAVPHPLQQQLEAVLNEYDRFLQSLEFSAQDHTRLRERQRLESHFAQHYTEEAHIRESQLQKRKQDFESLQAGMKLKLVVLEKQLAAMQSENRSLKAQQNEDTERYSSMAQSVIESRLAASKAELALIEMKEIYEKVRMVEKNNLELMQDYGRMLRLLRLHNITFDPKCTSMVDALIREGIQ